MLVDRAGRVCGWTLDLTLKPRKHMQPFYPDENSPAEGSEVWWNTLSAYFLRHFKML
jgi:hypothetical protein